jgi:sugar phosphate isomerase/epimerase
MKRRQFPAAAAAALLALNERAAAAPHKPRLRSAICAYSFRQQLQSKKMTYEDLVPLAVETGADGLDLTVYWFPSTEDSFLLPLRRLAYRNAVELYSISVRTDLCKPPGAARDAQAAELRKWVDVAHKLGASHIRVFGGNVPKDATEEQAAGWVVEMLKQAADYSGRNGVILGLENHGGITEKASTILQIVKQADTPWVGVNLDTGNFNGDAYRQIEMCLPHAVNAQFKTHIREQKGTSTPSDWQRLVKMFADSGYRGYFALEYEDKQDATVAVPPLTRKLGDLARQASA